MEAFRDKVVASDVGAIEALTRRTGMFRAEEVDIAVELVQDGLDRGPHSDYRFAFAEDADGVTGYACWGAIPCTVGAWDLYWIAVRPLLQGQGLGRALVSHVEAQVAAAGARKLFVDTSGRNDYAPTRGFYESCGYEVAARLIDFYAPSDDKVVYVRSFPG